MQEDMHYYGTYAMARAAGLKVKDAQVIAYAAQYVDDSTTNDSEQHEDGGMFETTATAHTTKEEIVTSFWKKITGWLDKKEINVEQRKVWVPFHFFPGGEGYSLSEKLKCVKDSSLAQTMVKNHIRHAVSVKDNYGLALMGIMAHVYADTFSHYGFSGVSSRGNDIVGKSIKLHIENEEMKKYLLKKYDGFMSKYVNRFRVKNWRKAASKMANVNEIALGHGAVSTYPDRPFLRWEFDYKNGNHSGLRDNHATFLEGCEKIHKAFSDYARQADIQVNPVEFDTIKEKVSDILAIEANKEGRIEAWKRAINNNDLFDSLSDEALDYSADEWNTQTDDFMDLANSYEAIETNVYKFHQAAIYHRNYTLKQLLPKHNIMVL
ncbi:MAG: hypothetical protein HFP78_06360 [Methylococcales symbiont of Hymedesmia sp. n. MRB-2018]|nr:MAG: hypothetical protein HFP78_06360 [Methylococcales symbiont of Hymedesmia sp. n. MRB-2018]